MTALLASRQPVASNAVPFGPTARQSTPKIKFAADSGFHRELKRRVFNHFEEQGLSQCGNMRMYVKSLILLLWFLASYASLVFVAATWWQAALCALSLAFAIAGIGFGVQHDANHGAYSEHAGVNRMMGITMDFLGASSYMWRIKHNVMHHTYVNITHADDDINVGPLARLSPAQAHHGFHRLQHYYLWTLYGLLLLNWHMIYDFKNLALARIAKTKFARPRGWALSELMFGKAVFITWAFIIPMAFHRWWVALLGYVATVMVIGLLLGIVFQLAHCVEEANFPMPTQAGRMPNSWAEHQVQTTVDFAQSNRLLSWYVGGLNFQIEHHLFPQICHVHYPQIATIVRQLCVERGLRYSVNATFFGALASHGRWIRRMGLIGLAPA